MSHEILTDAEAGAAARKASRCPHQWLPIGTAPRDGTEQLVVDVDGVRWLAAWRQYSDLVNDGLTCWRIDGGMRVYPTHWMPLPEAEHDLVEGR